MFGFLRSKADPAESGWDYVHRLHRERSDGPGAASALWSKVVVNADKSLTIKPEDGILFVRLMSHFGHPGPYLVALMRDHRAALEPSSVGAERGPDKG